MRMLGQSQLIVEMGKVMLGDVILREHKQSHVKRAFVGLTSLKSLIWLKPRTCLERRKNTAGRISSSAPFLLGITGPSHKFFLNN